MQISNGKVQSNHPEFDQSRETKPILGNMDQYHLFPMLFIFILISFAALFELGCANLITAIIVEDFAWFVNRWLVPLMEDPKAGRLMQHNDWTSMHLGAIDIGSFVIPNWYLVGIALAGIAYYIALRKYNIIIK